jgi:hypothetical protein
MLSAAWTEVQLAVVGTLRLAVGDRRGLSFFDPSIAGFWRSFRAGAICYPFYLVLLGFRVPTAQWTAHGAARIILVETIAYVISWVLFPLLVLHLSRWLGRENRFLPFMVAYNWSQIPQTGLFVLVGLEGAAGLATPSAARSVSLLAVVATLVYEWYIARVALTVTGTQATLVVIVDLLLGTSLGRIAAGLY